MPIENDELAAIRAVMGELGVRGESSLPTTLAEDDPRNDLRRALLELLARDARPELAKLKFKLPVQPSPLDEKAMEAWGRQVIAVQQQAAKPVADRLSAQADALLRPSGKELGYDQAMIVLLAETRRRTNGEFDKALSLKIRDADENTARLMLANMVSGRVMREEIASLQQRVGLEKAMKILNTPHREPLEDEDLGTTTGIYGPTKSWLEDALQGPNPATQFNAMLYAGADPNLLENDTLMKSVAGLPLKSIRQIMDKGTRLVDRGLLPVDGPNPDGSDRRINPLRLELSLPNRSGDSLNPVGETPLLQAIRAESLSPRATLLSPSQTSALLGFSPMEAKMEANPLGGFFRGASTVKGMMVGYKRAVIDKEEKKDEEKTFPAKLGEGQYYAIESLLQAGADPNIPGAGNINPLRSAAIRNDTALAKLLIRYKADVNYVYREAPQQNEDGTVEPGNEETPLTIALRHYRRDDGNDLALAQPLDKPKPERLPSVAEQLIDAGADMNWRDQEGRTVLMKLLLEKETSDERSEAIELLVRKSGEKGIDILNAMDKDGRTVLHRLMYYANTGNADTVMQLINLGASPLFDLDGFQEDEEGNRKEIKYPFLDYVRDNAANDPDMFIFLTAKGMASRSECLEKVKKYVVRNFGDIEDVKEYDAYAEKELVERANSLYRRKLLTALEAESLGATLPAQERLEAQEKETEPVKRDEKPLRPQTVPTETPKTEMPATEIPVTEQVPVPTDGQAKYAYREADQALPLTPLSAISKTQPASRSV